MSLCIILSLTIAVLSVALYPLLNSTQAPSSSSSSSSSVVADLMVTNGTIYTSDASLPFADSMALSSGRLLRLGNFSSLQDLAGYGTEVIDLEGKVVVPGFIDSHVHLIFGGLQIVRVELRGVNKKDEFVRKVKGAVASMYWKCLTTLTCITGPATSFPPGEPFNSSDKSMHNSLVVWLSRMDGHMGLANSLALKIAEISNYTEDPNGGAIMRTTDGEPTGLLIDSAMKLILSCVPEVSVDERREALVRASNLALMRGVTTVVDFGTYFAGASVELPWEDFSGLGFQRVVAKVLKSGCDRHNGGGGAVAVVECKGRSVTVADLIRESGRKLSQWLYLGGVKAFADGSLGSNSALFYEPYVDDPHNSGLQVADFESLLNMTVASDRSGLQVAIHAIGDRANDLILDMYKSVVSTNGMRDRRFRIEHAQHLADGTVARFGQEGIVASVQPDHLLDDADSAIRKLGVERAHKGSYLFQSLLASKAQLVFGSDWPVRNFGLFLDYIDPVKSVKTAMKRIPPGWENAWISSECINLSDALNAYASIFQLLYD
ncbi:hypothetical protein TEA_010116 [Camellia sinensis var. sinensis]|uniref:Amidohydrolase 3 domain-containing protein n=1 Tax=Camellia sinensis var. sinensis TaxID=542762 RepID=A0A4S4DPG1_CAMSN|nr:hypothetical protein TEA_010116 [Camellia sinensis var. sinensis]